FKNEPISKEFQLEMGHDPFMLEKC
ncbi:hypothetical protein LCGC14_2079900, partial [marine sediment metagenome]